jgi:hypothetical protein
MRLMARDRSLGEDYSCEKVWTADRRAAAFDAERLIATEDEFMKYPRAIAPWSAKFLVEPLNEGVMKRVNDLLNAAIEQKEKEDSEKQRISGRVDCIATGNFLFKALPTQFKFCPLPAQEH